MSSRASRSMRAACTVHRALPCGSSFLYSDRALLCLLLCEALSLLWPLTDCGGSFLNKHERVWHRAEYRRTASIQGRPWLSPNYDPQNRFMSTWWIYQASIAHQPSVSYDKCRTARNVSGKPTCPMSMTRTFGLFMSFRIHSMVF